MLNFIMMEKWGHISHTQVQLSITVIFYYPHNMEDYA